MGFVRGVLFELELLLGRADDEGVVAVGVYWGEVGVAAAVGLFGGGFDFGADTVDDCQVGFVAVRGVVSFTSLFREE